MDDLRNDVVANIRSCLISTKGRISLRQLEADYGTLIGSRIPYMKLGYTSLESFLSSEPSVYVSHGPNGQTFVDAKTSEKSAHISSMVSKQKNGKKKVLRTVAPNRHYNNNSYRPAVPIAQKWRSQKRGTNFTVPKPRATPVHNQFVRPSVPSKIVVPPRYREQPAVSPPLYAESPPFSPPLNGKAETNGHHNGDEAEEKNEEKNSCSPLTSTMRRISRLMSEINLERDSGNSSPTTEFGNDFKTYDFTKTGDTISDLKNLASHYKLGEIEVSFIEQKPKSSKGRLQFHCTVKVGQHKYSSYPDDFFDKDSAELQASNKALNDLVQKYGRRRSLLISSNDDIIERVPPMLEKHQGAVWSWQIEADYSDVYREQLPTDWLQVIDSSPFVSLEKCLGGYVLKHCNPDDVLQKGKRLDISLSLGEVSVPCHTVHFGEQNRICALITSATSTNEIWCQNYNSDDYGRFAKMVEQMDTWYRLDREEKAKLIKFGSCYVVFNENIYMRARALAPPEGDSVSCFLLDYGDDIVVPVDQVYNLRREFAVIPAQAFVCRLHGLEDLHEHSIESEHMASLMGKEYTLELVTDESGGSTEVPAPVVMYDDSTGESVNEQLLSLLTIESATPTLDKNAITEAYISNIESNGDVYVQIRGAGYHHLMDMLDQLATSVTNEPPRQILEPVTKKNSENRLYLLKNVSKQWRRASIIDWSPNCDMAQVYFVDHGNTEVVKVKHETMYPLDKLDQTVSQFPPQALKVRIMLENVPVDFVDRAYKLMPQYHDILLKVISYDNEKVAWVEFFKRSNDGGLFCINKSIALEAEMQNNCLDKTARSRAFSTIVKFGDNKSVPSGGSLKKPNLPEKGKYFNINVPFAVNPWNFFVQPLDTLDKLTGLMSDMQETYSQIQFSPIQIEDVIPGTIYASKHEDGLWYRTSVLKVISTGLISAFFVDFGYYTNLTVAQLIPLDLKYMDLPYQALKAKIAGIKPAKDKWSMDDCDFFNNLVTKKQLVSVIVNIDNDVLHTADIVLQLLLVDTSSEVDVHIKELLIEKGIAVSV